ncbi:Acetyl-/propionyl-coenzyme A carboxylase alpha chain [Ensifer psoraleae]|uniref:ATP-binding protein n=1 Tax=Sinorhizobium psoraleae TaxID=520838 RepID=UPI0024AAC0C8|nr:hypothetical protein [Sinorhizobium psoraleae]NRP70936.1 Acetyl-/propionyl-coenzyme A carboxylase alpha chain [Sinorhizobium psoraleae]
MTTRDQFPIGSMGDLQAVIREIEGHYKAPTGVALLRGWSVHIKRCIEQPRHIEVQVLGDAFGNVIRLFERECSPQRRFQKIIEEAPGVNASPALRERICETAVDIARAANRRNAGTIEFTVDGGEFYFLEINTRLQVEHPFPK